jgi:hypothetical protein
MKINSIYWAIFPIFGGPKPQAHTGQNTNIIIYCAHAAKKHKKNRNGNHYDNDWRDAVLYHATGGSSSERNVARAYCSQEGHHPDKIIIPAVVPV